MGLRARVEERFDEVKKFCDETFGADETLGSTGGRGCRRTSPSGRWGLRRRWRCACWGYRRNSRRVWDRFSGVVNAVVL